MKKIYLLSVLLVSAFFVKGQEVKPNIILVVFDDLNDMVQGYGGHPQAITPNLLNIQGKGTTFTNAFCSAPLCAPSRTSMMMGKSPEYTDIFQNNPYDCTDFRNNFPGGKFILTMPQHLKDSAEYFTYSVGKIFHCDNELSDYDVITPDPCTKKFSWNKYTAMPIDNTVSNAGQANPEGVDEMKWSAIDSSLITFMTDYNAVDTASLFFDAYDADPSDFCGKPFFLGVGIRKPHSNLYIPEQYFSDFYITDFYAEPWDYNYNLPLNTYPYNGVVNQPLTTPEYIDFDSLPYLSRAAISLGPHTDFKLWPGSLSPTPNINDTLNSVERKDILTRIIKANALIAYLAAVRFADDQFGRLMDSLEAHPAIYNNTVIIITSDHGFTLGEKKHWGKGILHETDARIPFIIADLRTVSPAQICNKTVSHLDIFPTVNEYAGGPTPKFPDGTDYLDGFSLLPLLANPVQQWERGAVTQVKNSIDGYVCFPQSSVRTDRFQYIRWESNNAVGLTGCDSLNNYQEKELYELGVNREIDPEEWNNLADDPAYAPVIDYLDMFMPDGSLFLQKTLKATVSISAPACLFDNDDIVKLRSKLYNIDGTQLTGSGLSAYTFTWTNSVTATSFTGRNYNFNMTTVPSATYTSNSRILFYLKVTETATGKLVAFETKTIYINPASAPNAAYDVSLTGTTASIINYSQTGSYTNTNWNYGDGYSTEDYLPGSYTYAGAGTYSIKNSLYYGNKSTCKVTVTRTITVLSPPERTGYADFSIYPNPNDGTFTLDIPASVQKCLISMYNDAGSLVFQQAFENVQSLVHLDADAITTGIYIVEVTADTYTQRKLVQIQNE